jgi:prepilin-type N-terminal cleavage/methylation domain-containing protein
LHRQTQSHKAQRTQVDGFSLVELLTVVAVICILTAIALPQLIAQRRLVRSAGIPREIATQLRFARQQAMSQRQAFTFQYDNVNKTIRVIDNNATGISVLTDGSYPNNAGSRVVQTSSLAVGGVPNIEINYGIPSGLPTGALADGTSNTSLTNGKINITFQPNGSVIDATGNPVDRAIFIYNTRVPRETAGAISVIGSAGRVKMWRYAPTTNTYIE